MDFALFTASTRETAPSFSKTLLKWRFTVASVMVSPSGDLTVTQLTVTQPPRHVLHHLRLGRAESCTVEVFSRAGMLSFGADMNICPG
ncbi:hypothetical protein [Streptomyces halstedii]|uniref:hypothetical protein n=1 Tax=Streptomyces halstedii TaxID=1944 RepID=UPI0036634785